MVRRPPVRTGAAALTDHRGDRLGGGWQTSSLGQKILEAQQSCPVVWTAAALPRCFAGLPAVAASVISADWRTRWPGVATAFAVPRMPGGSAVAATPAGGRGGAVVWPVSATRSVWGSTSRVTAARPPRKQTGEQPAGCGAGGCCGRRAGRGRHGRGCYEVRHRQGGAGFTLGRVPASRFTWTARCQWRSRASGRRQAIEPLRATARRRARR